MKAYLALSLITAVSLLAQPPQGAGPRGHFGPPPDGTGPGGPNLEYRLTRSLSLTAEQQNKVHTAIEESHVQTKGMMEQMQNLHKALAAAVKSGDESQIEKASTDIANLHQQQTSIHGKTMAKVYAALTADQKTKVGPNLEMLMGPGVRGPGMRRPPANGVVAPPKESQQ